ncbi:hypothetical protein KKB18_09190, partial [bacterium]|nr:hypothetical protein [bacterium]
MTVKSQRRMKMWLIEQISFYNITHRLIQEVALRTAVIERVSNLTAQHGNNELSDPSGYHEYKTL